MNYGKTKFVTLTNKQIKNDVKLMRIIDTKLFTYKEGMISDILGMTLLKIKAKISIFYKIKYFLHKK